MNRAHPTVAIGALAILVLVAAGCGDDDDAGGATTTSSRPVTTDAPATGETSAAAEAAVEFCDAALAIEVVDQPDLDWETASEEEIADALATYGTEVMRPLADDILASVPAEVADEAAVLAAAVDDLAAGDTEAFDAPDVVAAADVYDPFVDEECGWTAFDVTAADYSFTGLPSEVEAGPTRIRLANTGTEVHEILLLRRNPGVDLSVEELFELSEEEAFALVTPAGPPAFAPPGGSETEVYDLEPGDYIAICMIPTGITSEESVPAPDAPPHAAHGMVTELTVT